MKKFAMHGMFLLPENFQGTVSDALRILADYFENPNTKKLEGTAPEPNPIQVEAWSCNYYSWWDVVREGGKFSGQVVLANLVNNKWEALPHGVKNARTRTRL